MSRIPPKQAGGIFVILAAAVISTNSSADRSGPRRHEVVAEGLEFRPSRLTLHVGDTVVWMNRDVVPHTVTAVDGTRDGGGLDQGEWFRMVVSEPGAIEYFCQYHPRMTGNLEVSER